MRNKLAVLPAVLVLVFALSSLVSAEQLFTAVVGYPYYQTGGYETKQPSTKDEYRSGYEGGYVASWDEAGAWVEWLIDVPEAGDYFFFVRYATSGSAGARHDLNIGLLNGDDYISIESLGFPIGGSWGNYDWVLRVVSEYPLTLKKGQNVVRLTLNEKDRDNGGMNVLNLGFVKDAGGVPAMDGIELMIMTDIALYGEQ